MVCFNNDGVCVGVFELVFEGKYLDDLWWCLGLDIGVRASGGVSDWGN